MLRAFGITILILLTAVVGAFAAEGPIAQFTYSPGDGPYAVLFDASGSTDPDGEITSYQWTFGDGTTGSGEKVAHTYPAAGSFSVTLVVFDTAHATATATETVTIAADGTVSAPPVPEFARAAVPVGLNVGNAAPEFSLTDAAGKVHSLSDYLGKVVILEFWRLGCPHCRATMPHLKELYERYKDDGLVVVLVTPDWNMAATQSYLDQNGYSDFINLWDDPRKGDDQVTAKYKVWTVPHTLLIDRHGVIRYTGYPNKLLDSNIVPWL